MARVRSYGSILDVGLIILDGGTVMLTAEQMSLCTLEHDNTGPTLTAVIETLRQHMEVWACMNRMKDIATALWTVYQTWRSRGTQNRFLFKLLTEVDNECYLEPAAREQMQSDISAYTHVCPPTFQQANETN